MIETNELRAIITTGNGTTCTITKQPEYSESLEFVFKKDGKFGTKEVILISDIKDFKPYIARLESHLEITGKTRIKLSNIREFYITVSGKENDFGLRSETTECKYFMDFFWDMAKDIYLRPPESAEEILENFSRYNRKLHPTTHVPPIIRTNIKTSVKGN